MKIKKLRNLKERFVILVNTEKVAGREDVKIFRLLARWCTHAQYTVHIYLLTKGRVS